MFAVDDVGADGLQQVGFAQPHPPVDEKRVVSTRRGFGDGHGSGVGEPVARADDEGVEGVFGRQGQAIGGARDGRGGRGERGALVGNRGGGGGGGGQGLLPRAVGAGGR